MKIKGAFRGPAIAAELLLLAATAWAQEASERSGYSYIRLMTGEATVASRLNGNVEARRNMPISIGDEISVSQAGHVEVGLADGNILFLGGGSRVSFESLYDQQGEQDQFSGVRLLEGDLVLTGLGSNEQQIPRVDTEDATVYLSPGAHVRVNSDPRRGTVVIGRAGSAEVRTRAGTYTVKAGQYLMVRTEEEPEIGRGAFSRDRLDLWVADRMVTLDETRSATSARYVSDQYSSDVAALDGYGDWDYDSGYGGDVWSPRVDAGWSPYSYGSWYYTPAGLTWWSFDPWGWYPFHYGNWFFARNRWCWAPASVYSPAWVYWGYSPGFVGWCPIGYYSSPWWNTYYRQWGFQPRTNLYFAIHGTFSTRSVDFRGWNFTGAGSFGATMTRASVIPGSRIANRLGSQVAISSHPIVVDPREGGTREALRTFVREAPRTIERTAGPDSQRLAPVLARERTLPVDTVAALRERAVAAERGRLTGPAAAEIAPRGAIVERSRTPASRPVMTSRDPVIADRRGATTGRSFASDMTLRERGPGSVGSDQAPRRIAPRANGDETWRARGNARPGEAREIAPRARAVSPDRPSSAPPAATRSESWRSRSEVPPARRVIEGAVPERRRPEARSESWRGREFRPESAPPQRIERTPIERAPAYALPSARLDRLPPSELPRGHVDRAPAYAPPPARMDRLSPSELPRSRMDRGPYSPPPTRLERPPYSAPPARIERAPYSAPPKYLERAPAPGPRPEVHHEAPQRSAPRAERERHH
jgi:hypothetical protein